MSGDRRTPTAKELNAMFSGEQDAAFKEAMYSGNAELIINQISQFRKQASSLFDEYRGSGVGWDPAKHQEYEILNNMISNLEAQLAKIENEGRRSRGRVSRAIVQLLTKLGLR